MGNFRPLPPLEELQKILSYDSGTGIFTWLSSKGRRREGSAAGTVRPSGYIQIYFERRAYLAHRLAWLFATGEDPGDYTIDHINRKRADNRFENLRLATRQQQQGNHPVHSNNTSGVRGVCFSRQRNRWVAQIMINGKQTHLGRFATKEEAAATYQKAAAAYFGEFLAN